MRARFIVFLALAWPALAQAADAAENYPERPVRLIVPAGPGSSNDTMARVLGARLADALGRTVVVDNRAGAGGIIGTETAVRAIPDGHTLLTVSTASVIFTQLHRDLSFDLFRDLVPIGMFTTLQNVFVANPALPSLGIKEFIALAKSRPGQLNMASAGTGSQSHLAGVQFLVLSGVNVVHVPYKDGGASVAAVIANESQFAITPLPAVIVHVKSGRLRALATGGDKRSKQLPEVPTVIEAGLPGYHSTGWMGLQAPRGTPKPILAKLNRTLVAVMSQPEARDQIERQGGEAVAGTPEQFAGFMREEWNRFGTAIKAAGLKIE